MIKKNNITKYNILILNVKYTKPGHIKQNIDFINLKYTIYNKILLFGLMWPGIVYTENI